MRAENIVRQVLRDVEGKIHRARLKTVSAAVLALIRGGQISLAALGRAVGPRSYKHGIKRIDRLLGNEALAEELEVIYAAIIRHVLRSVKRPVILIDWTDTGDQMSTKTAAEPKQGRAITIYSTTLTESQYASPRVHTKFLETLRTLLARDCRPILVTDAGFQGPWMRCVRAMNWEFVTRIRGRTFVQRDSSAPWQRWKELIGEARRTPRSLGTHRIIRSQNIAAELVVVDRRPRFRPTTPRNARALRATRAHHEPWFLATSSTLPAKQIVSFYAARMQIELAFRDLKSHRFGWGFEDSRCGSTKRVAIQIMLAALASLIVLLVGLAAEAAGHRKQFQANTITKRRVLSLVTLGRAVLATLNEHIPIYVGLLRNRLQFVGIP